MIATESLEPIFIKNLENVQGDERDIILFSVGYGPDKDNKIYLNFGPLNREGGWRRLNVAVSRARYEMIVFSTLKAEQIDITRTSSKGVSGLKAFLEFAEKGKKSSSILKFIGKPENGGITSHLEKRLVSEGYNILTNIGSSGFKIDLGITDPEVPSEYLLGVLCDGQNYKDLKTANDREIIQADVLHNLGWKIHKVWSCDWWDNDVKVINEIKQLLKEGKKQDSQVKNVESRPQELLKIDTSLIVQPSDIVTNASKYKESYVISILPVRNSSPQFDLLNSLLFKESIVNDILSILENEAPISKDLLCRRILNSWSISRLGSRIDAYFTSVFKQMNMKYSEGSKLFYWNENQDPESYFTYRISTLESQRRDASDISPIEVSNAVHEILENSISLNKIDLIRESAKLFGYNRINGNVELSMKDGIMKAAARGFAIIEDERVFLKE